MPDWFTPSWWADIAFQGIAAAVVGGVLSGVVAWLTVRWTMRATRDAAVQSRRIERSHAAAFQLTIELDATFRGVAEASAFDRANEDGVTEAVLAFGRAVVLYGPDLTDEEVFERVSEVRDLFFAYEEWNLQAPRPGIDVSEAGIVSQGSDPVHEERAAHKRALGTATSWLGQSLAAHRNEKPLPEPLTFRAT